MGGMPTYTGTTPIRPGQIWEDDLGRFEVVVVSRTGASITISNLADGAVASVPVYEFNHARLVEEV